MWTAVRRILIGSVMALIVLSMSSATAKELPRCENDISTLARTGEVPIIWIHGMAGGCTTWDADLEPDGVTSYYFRYDHAGDFTDPEWTRKLDETIGIIANNPTGQVDIVAHSMGGLLSRYYLSQPSYARNAGKVRNLIMVGTPNRGSALAYGVRLSDMIDDPQYYNIPKNRIDNGKALYKRYLKETRGLHLLVTARPTFQRWVAENTNEWEILAAMDRPMTRSWERRSETGKKMPWGSTADAPYTDGFERLAGLLIGAYQQNFWSFTTTPPPVDPIDSIATWGLLRQFTIHEKSMAFDRLMPESLSFVTSVDRWGGQKVVSVPTNPVLLRLNKERNARPGTAEQQLVGVATITRGAPSVADVAVNALLSRGVDPTLEMDLGDAIVERRSVDWGFKMGTDAFYVFEGPMHVQQGSNSTVREIVGQVRRSRFRGGGLLSLGDTPAAGQRVLDPGAPGISAAIQRYLVDGSLAYLVRHDGSAKALPLKLVLENPLFPVRLWIYAEYRDRPGTYYAREVIAPVTLRSFDFSRFSQYYIVMREQTPLTIAYTYGDQASVEQPPAAGLEQTDSLMLLDVSGSMEGAFASTSKMEAARQVALQMVTLRTLQGKEPGRTTEGIPGLITFDSESRLLALPGQGGERIRSVIGTLQPGGGTNMGAAIEQGLEALTGEGKKELLLLTDGLPGPGLTATEILEQLAPRARDQGVVIHAIGFGQPGEVDEEFLSALAQSTGGQYTFAASPYELENRSLHAYHLSAGDPVGTFTGMLAEGESVTVTTLPVSESIASVALSLNWPGSQMDLELVDPRGREVDAGYPGATWSSSARPRHVLIENPVAGSWTVRVAGTDLPDGPEPFSLHVSATPTGAAETPGSVAGIWFLLGILALIIGLVGWLTPDRAEATA